MEASRFSYGHQFQPYMLLRPLFLGHVYVWFLLWTDDSQNDQSATYDPRIRTVSKRDQGHVLPKAMFVGTFVFSQCNEATIQWAQAANGSALMRPKPQRRDSLQDRMKRACR